MKCSSGRARQIALAASWGETSVTPPPSGPAAFTPGSQVKPAFQWKYQSATCRLNGRLT
jgi:hypothetical protein